MTLKYTMAIAALAISTAAQSQAWTPDTIATGVGYSQDGFFSLTSGMVKQEPAHNWDIGFMTGSAFSAAVMVNHYGGTTGATSNARNNKLYLINENAAATFGDDFTNDTTAIIANSALYENQPFSWEEGAFNQHGSGPMSYGWGAYDQATHYITGNKLYLLKNRSGYFQVWIEQYQANLTPSSRLWKFHIANLNGSDTQTINFVPGNDYAPKMFGYFSFETKQFINREPNQSEWHLLATRYPDAYHDSSSAWMSTTGIVANTNIEIAAVWEKVPNDADSADAEVATYSVAKNTIGGKYKVVDMTATPPGWAVYDSLSYFARIVNGTDSGDIWQFYFDYFPAGTSGDVKIGLQKRLVYKYVPVPSAVNDVNNYVGHVVLAPNPVTAGSYAHLLLDVKQPIKGAQLSITDISGRIVQAQQVNLNNGFVQLPLNTNQLRSGLYFVQLSGAGFSTTQKLVIQ